MTDGEKCPFRMFIRSKRFTGNILKKYIYMSDFARLEKIVLLQFTSGYKQP